MQLPDDGARLDVERGEEIARAMADVVVRVLLGLSAGGQFSSTVVK